MAALDNFQQIPTSFGGEALKPPVIKDQQCDFTEAAHHAVMCSSAFITCSVQRGNQFWNATVEGRLFLHARLMGQRTGQIGFPCACQMGLIMPVISEMMVRELYVTHFIRSLLRRFALSVGAATVVNRSMFVDSRTEVWRCCRFG